MEAPLGSQGSLEGEEKKEMRSDESGTLKLKSPELVARASHFLETLLEIIGLEVKFRCEQGGDVVRVWLDGRDAGLVLSNNARLLYAVNHLLNQIFFRRSADGCSFVVDCNHYRSTRAAELQLLAKKAAEKVKTSTTPLSLQAMPASERRVAHLALAGEPGVTTESQGFGARRYVVIIPTSHQ